MRAVAACLLSAVVVAPHVAPASPHRATNVRSVHATATIAPNDNRQPAGRLSKGVLTLALEARTGEWHPFGAKGPAIATAAFAETGRPLQTPGPLIRVPVGTEVHATVHNALAKPMWLYGMGEHRGIADSVAIAAGETRDMRFHLTEPGTFYYVARTGTAPVSERLFEDSQLGGVIVVDPPGASTNDRIFAVTTWFTIDPKSRTGLGPVGTMTFNGRAFPNTEHMELVQGDSAHWRFANLSFLDHPLHLHGFYFRVDARGDGLRDSVYTPQDRRMAVTEYMAPMSTMAMSWSPNRSGNWIFHCHFAGHMSPLAAFEADRTSMERSPLTMSMSHTMNHAMKNGVMQAGAPATEAVMDHMSNLVIGIHVKPRGPAPDMGEVARHIRLIIRSKARVYGDNVGYSFALGGSPEEADTSGMKAPGPTIELTRGERVAVTIVNHSKDGESVHWHGIEIESYSDGVPDWSGDMGKILPMIAPGDSLTVRFTPPRAGTFMYHSHSNEFQQISSGLYGALIVREPGAQPDSSTDKILLFSDNGPTINLANPTLLAGTLLNGQTTPQAIVVKAGVPTRLRLINIRSDKAEVVSIMEGDHPAMWRVVAKDGFTRPANQAEPRTAELVFGAGETYDVEITPRSDAPLTLVYKLAASPPKLDQRGEVPLRVTQN